MSVTVYFNRAFVPKDEVRISPDDRGFLFADGVHEVVRATAAGSSSSSRTSAGWSRACAA